MSALVAALICCIISFLAGEARGCQTSQSKCTRLTAPSYGTVTNLKYKSQSRRFARARYSCQKGYRLQGSAIRRCVRGCWLGKTPSCQKKSECKFPSPSEFSVGPKVTIISNKFQKATYGCMTGYRMIGSEKVVCRKGRLSGSPPSCELDVFSGSGQPCNFLEISHNCQYVSDMNDLIKWKMTTPTCGPAPIARHRMLSMLQPVVSRSFKLQQVQLRRLNVSLQKMVENDFLTRHKRGTEDLSTGVVTLSCSPMLELRLPAAMTTKSSNGSIEQEETKRSATRVRALSRFARSLIPNRYSATFEVGLLSNTAARYVKFSLEAPLDAVRYAVVVAGHCSPDPPGSLYLVHFISTESTAESVSRTFCLNLHKTVKCRSTGSFSFSLRVTLYYLHLDDKPKSIRFRRKGVYENFSDALCPGGKAENE